MRQSSYDTIVACIQHGAAATANVLIAELNGVVNDSNQLRQVHQTMSEVVENVEQTDKEENTETGE
jgi:hypothetical protein